ncbi:hypothetical protein J2I47_01835 [Fibrella sp. HMF5335]|uniref:Uncharacterized protein n=1 Tax=Fibrella rubiginis TaxID=2817060 RepID=A0A939GDK9_9BACT|nr:hypothetical protein [Fibrella rubiginis]MBO0935279.1 hypothetical protein [Fibrella rubiginis]
MDLSDELLEQIGAYLAGQLPAGEKDQFEARIQQDPQLRQEVALQRELKQGLSFLAQKDRFRQLHADLDKRGLLPDIAKQTAQPELAEAKGKAPDLGPLPAQSQPVRQLVRFGRASWVMAASLALLLGVGWLLYTNRADKRQELAQNEAAFTHFFSPHLKPAPTLLPDPDRVAAAPENSQSGQDSVRLQVATQGLNRADGQPTIQELTVLAAKTGHWGASAQWYLALAYLKANQRTQARPLLNKIAQLNGHPYQQEARQLLNQLSASAPAP